MIKMSAHIPHAPAPGTSQDLSLRYFWGLLMRHWKLVAGCVVGVAALAALLLSQTRPTYQSEASVRVEQDRDGADLLSQLSPIRGMGKGAIATEVLVLRSYALAAEVGDSLDLHVRVQEPQVPRAQVISALEAPPETEPGTYVLERAGDGYTVRAEDGGLGVDLPERVQPATPFSLGKARITLARGTPDRVVIRVRDFRRAVESVRSSMNVSRPHPEAEIVQIEYRDTDPLLAAEVPNVLTRRFIADKRRVSKARSSSTVAFLQEQVQSYQGELSAAETALRDFREREHVVSPRDQASEAVKRLADLQATRDELNGQRETLRRLLTRAENGETGADGVSPYRQLASFPVFLANPSVQDLLRALLGQENIRADLLQQRTPDNPDVQQRTARIQELEQQIHQLAVNYLATLDSQIAALDQNLARFGTEMAAVPATEVQFARLARQQELLAEIYTLLQTRLKEAEIQVAADPANVRVIDPALVPVRPASPRPVRTMAIALMLGLLLGMGSALAWETLDNKVRNRSDVQAATGGMPILAYIPAIRAAVLANGARGNGKKPHSPDEVLAQRLVARSAPQSAVAEAYRSLRTNLTLSSFEAPPRVLVVASAMPGDGKSTTASNLAITLAQQGTRTLLVDADLRKGLLHQILGVKREPGLTNVLMGRVPLEEAVQVVALGDGAAAPLHFLGTGPYPPNPSEALGSERMRALVEQLRERYEMIIFDAPPLNLVTDAAVLGKIADATVLIARAGATDKGALQHAATQLETVRAPVVGVVLNNFDLAGSGYYGYGSPGAN